MTVTVLKSRLNDIEKIRNGFNVMINTGRENPENIKKMAEVCGFDSQKDLENMLNNNYIINMLTSAYNDAIDNAECPNVSIE
jgi:hypothetical protein